MTVCAMSDYSFTCRVYASDIEIMFCILPPPDDYHESNPHPGHPVHCKQQTPCFKISRPPLQARICVHYVRHRW
jgi:hypothetical protein